MKRKLDLAPKLMEDLEIRLATIDSLAIEAMILKRQV